MSGSMERISCENGLQNGVVSGVAPTVSAADHHAVPVPGGAVMAAEDLPVDLELGVHGLLDGELGGGLFIELLSQVAAERIVPPQVCQVPSQGLPIAGLDQVAVDVVIDQIGDAAHGGGHGGQMEPSALGEGVGEGLRQGGEGIDVQGVVEGVHAAADPAGEGHLIRHAQLLGQGPQLLPLRAVSGDDQTQPGTALIGRGKAPDQSGHILDGVEAGGDAHHHAVLVGVHAQAPQIGQPVPLGRGRGEVDAVVDRVKPVCREAPGDQQVHHGVGDADAVVQMPQGPGVDIAKGQTAEGTAHIVQPVVAVDGADHRQSGGSPEKRAHHVGPGAVAVDQLKAAVSDIGRQFSAEPGDVVALHDLRGDAQAPGLLGEGTVPEADQLGRDGLVQVLQQTEHMGLGAAGVAAADEMDDFHGEIPPFVRIEILRPGLGAGRRGFYRLALQNRRKYYTMFPVHCPQKEKTGPGPVTEETMEEKTKRVGKFNVVDVIAVILILAVAALVGWKLLGPDDSVSAERAMTKVTYVVKVEGVPAELYDNCIQHLPSPLMASGALVGGEIVDVEQEPYYVLSAGGDWIEDETHTTLLFTAVTETPTAEVMTTKVGDQEVRIGKTDYILKSEFMEFADGTIVDVQWGE